MYDLPGPGHLILYVVAEDPRRVGRLVFGVDKKADPRCVYRLDTAALCRDGQETVLARSLKEHGSVKRRAQAGYLRKGGSRAVRLVVHDVGDATCRPPSLDPGAGLAHVQSFYPGEDAADLGEERILRALGGRVGGQAAQLLSCEGEHRAVTALLPPHARPLRARFSARTRFSASRFVRR